MASLREMKQDRTAAIQKAEGILSAAESAGRALSASETLDFDSCTAEASDLATKIDGIERRETLAASLRANGGMLLGAGPNTTIPASGVAAQTKMTLSSGYVPAFIDYLSSAGAKTSAALYEGAAGAGGFAVPTTTAGNVTALVPPEIGVASIATVIPTVADLKIPVQTTFSVAAAKAESGAGVNLFSETGPGIGGVTLGANMAGSFAKLSFELVQDVSYFTSFTSRDLMIAQQQLEESWFVNGNGVGQAQGLIGNVGPGISVAADPATALTIDNTYDLLGSLKEAYLERAHWLMNRHTSIFLRKLQRANNLFEPIFTRDAGTDYLHGIPITYSAAMSTAAKGTTPLLLGDFATGYVIGYRGGTGMMVKLLDQPFAVAGQIAVLCYRRCDGKVRVPEAIQQLSLT